MKILISGGCKNGKSTYAQRLAKYQQTAGPLYYVATMIPHDGEDTDRIRRHRSEREGWGFQTIELPARIEGLLQYDSSGSYLLDSLTALLANEMFQADGEIWHEAKEKIAEGLRQVLNHTEHIVLVSDYIYSDALIYDALSEEYRAALAYIDRTAAALCDTVIEVSFTNRIVHKGSLPEGLLYA